MRLQAGPTAFVVGGGRLQRGEVALREERRHRVREQHLGDDALRLRLLQPALAVPVAVRGRRQQIGEGIDVGVGPGVELVVPARREVRLVLTQLGAGVPVDRDDRVPARRVQCLGPARVASAVAPGETLLRDAGLGTGRDDASARRAALLVEPRPQLADRQRLRPEPALGARAPELDQEPSLLGRLDAFGDHVETEVVGEADDAPDDRRVARVARELA